MCQILVIDDEQMILNMLRQVLTRYGHRVETAGDGQEGIEKFLEGQFDMVLTDVCMPGMDGNQVMHRIRTSPKSDTPLIAMSGTPWALTNKGYNRVLPKPFVIQELLDTVKILCQERQPGSAA